MNTDKLSKRLETAVKYITGGTVADIGSDHAYLPCYSVKKGIVSRAIAGEVVEGPFQSAKRQVASEGLTDVIDVRKGSGLSVVNPNEVHSVTICGMGGALIAEILEADKEVTQTMQRLILQPNISAISIREWLVNNGWGLVAEEILEEDGKIYEVLVAEKTEEKPSYSELEMLVGPYLLKEKNAAFIKKWEGEVRNWERILGHLETAQATEENEQRKQAIKAQLEMVQEVIR